jgi:hypothetical protein
MVASFEKITASLEKAMASSEKHIKPYTIGTLITFCQLWKPAFAGRHFFKNKNQLTMLKIASTASIIKLPKPILQMKKARPTIQAGITVK